MVTAVQSGLVVVVVFGSLCLSRSETHQHIATCLYYAAEQLPPDRTKHSPSRDNLDHARGEIF